MMYKKVLKPIFFRFDPEYVHNVMTRNGVLLGKCSLGRMLTKAVYGYKGKDISKTVDGITYPTPYLLSAGFDYNGHLSRILPCIGLGGEEVGSVSARPSEGNPRPRLTRLPRSQSIIVNKGLRNEGVDKVIERLKRDIAKRKDSFVVGVSIARTNDDKSVSVEAGIEDYCYSLRRLNEEGVGDYYTINISCPNAFGGEAFTKPELLEKLVEGLKKVQCTKPVYFKMPINVPWEQFNALLSIIDKSGYQGVIIGNLNKDYNALDFRDEAPQEYRGGLSGKPCRNLSTELIKKTRETWGKRFTIIGVGGVMSEEAAMEKFNAGADLIQLITGMIYEGPGLIKRLCASYAKSRI